ncbi:MAG: hypothetical protein V1663_02310 [archaeon]
MTEMKKGQVTMFIVLGLVLVAVFIAAYSLKDYVLKSASEREAEKLKISEEFIPVYESYKECVNNIALDGITIMASQGGYIDIPRYEYLVNPLLPFSNKLQVFNDEAFEVAYWFYESGSGIQTEKIPKLSEMEQDLSNYINNNLYICTSNFTGFEGYVINDFDSFDTTVNIEDNLVFVEVKSNFNVDYKGLNQKFSDLSLSVDSSLGYLHSKAIQLYNKEKDENYFEEKTIDYLVIYDQIPYSGESFSCNPRVWNKQNVEKDFKEILEVNTDAVGKINEDYYWIDLGDNDLGLSFMYKKDWPFFMEINGGEEILREESAFGENNPAAAFLGALFCLNNYHFIYDIKYPVMATLSKNSLDFNFAYEIIIDNNQPKQNLLGMEELSLEDNKVCDYKNTLFTFYAVDYETEQFIDNVDVKLSCVGNSCDIGTTSLDEYGEYSLTTNVPTCVNADIKTYKEDYNLGISTISTNEEAIGYVVMKPYHKMNVVVKIVENDELRNPYDDETIFINFVDEEDKFSQFLNQDTVDLIKGDYIIRSYIMKSSQEPMKIEGNNVEYCNDIPRGGILGALGLTEKKCFTNKLDDVELDQVLVGGNEFKWSYDGNDGDRLTIYVTYDKMPSTVTEMGDIYQRVFDESRVRYPEVI